MRKSNSMCTYVYAARQETGSSEEDMRMKVGKSDLVLNSISYIQAQIAKCCHSACGHRGPSDGMHDKVCYRGHMLKNSICEGLKRTNDVQVMQFRLQACESKWQSRWK